jgi:squalene synthase HpnC
VTLAEQLPGLAPATDLKTAQTFTRRLAHTHYENFSVISWFVPRRLRQDFCNVYAFCRLADDAADEQDSPQAALAMLGELKELTNACYEGKTSSALFVALSETIRRHDLPRQPFLDLIDAFEQDQRVRRYDTFPQLLDYCRRSANPVGRLVLYLCGYRDEARKGLADKICTALQLTNFWQDVRRDILERDRIYIPRHTMRQFGVNEEQIREGRCDDSFRALLRHEVERTEAFFAGGDALAPMLDKKYRRQIMLFSRGGRAILQAIRRQDYDTLSHRPKLSAWRKGRLMLTLLVGGGRVRR